MQIIRAKLKLNNKKEAEINFMIKQKKNVIILRKIEFEISFIYKNRLINPTTFPLQTMHNLSIATVSNLSFEWMKLTGPHLQSCCLLHPETSHFQQIINKMIKTTTISKNFYIFFHLLPFLLRFKKNMRQGKLSKAFFKAFRNYFKSILFIAHLVGGLKLLKCVAVTGLNQVGVKLDGKIFLWGSFISSLGIFWQQSIRRQQITYFAFVRSIRSSYMFLKRRNLVSFKNQMQICFVLIFGLMSYIFTAFPQTVKFTHILEHIWGKF